MNDITVSQLDLDNKLNFSRGRYNILDCGVRTGKTYWAIHNLQRYTRDGRNSRILFLVDTIALKEALIIHYPEECCDADAFWKLANVEMAPQDYNKIGVMCYQSLGAAVIKEQVDFLKNIDVICWDECDSIFDFAASAFVKARKYDFSRESNTNQEILTVIQQYSSKRDYMPLILLGFWEKIVNEGDILCIGLSASPERARMYYASLTQNSYEGRILTTLRASQDIYFKNVLDHIPSLVPVPGVGYWCYSPSITNNRAIVRCANQQGFSSIELHSRNNENEPMTAEQLRVLTCIETTGMVPIEYNFVVITRAFERGIDIKDPRFKHVIIDSYYQQDRIQAARQTFPHQRHVKVLTFGVPDEYKNRWLTLAECRELAEYMAIQDINLSNSSQYRQGRIMSWNKLQEFLPSIGYTVEKARKRVAGKPNAVYCYKITGEWHDVEFVVDGDFMQLVAAKSTQELLESGEEL